MKLADGYEAVIPQFESPRNAGWTLDETLAILTLFVRKRDAEPGETGAPAQRLSPTLATRKESLSAGAVLAALTDDESDAEDCDTNAAEKTLPHASTRSRSASAAPRKDGKQLALRKKGKQPALRKKGKQSPQPVRIVADVPGKNGKRSPPRVQTKLSQRSVSPELNEPPQSLDLCTPVMRQTKPRARPKGRKRAVPSASDVDFMSPGKMRMAADGVASSTEPEECASPDSSPGARRRSPRIARASLGDDADTGALPPSAEDMAVVGDNDRDVDEIAKLSGNGRKRSRAVPRRAPLKERDPNAAQEPRNGPKKRRIVARDTRKAATHAKKENEVILTSDTPQDKENTRPRTTRAAKLRAGKKPQTRVTRSKRAADTLTLTSQPSADPHPPLPSLDEISVASIGAESVGTDVISQDGSENVSALSPREKSARQKHIESLKSAVLSERDTILQHLRDKLEKQKADLQSLAYTKTTQLHSAYNMKLLKYPRKTLDMRIGQFASNGNGSFGNLDGFFVKETEESVEKLLQEIIEGRTSSDENLMPPPPSAAARARRQAVTKTASKVARKYREKAHADVESFTARRSQRTAAKASTMKTRTIMKHTTRRSRMGMASETPQAPRVFGGGGGFEVRLDTIRKTGDPRKRLKELELLKQQVDELISKEAADALADAENL